MAKTTKPAALDAVLERIAREHLFLETLATRGSDRLDFHDLSVAGVRAALKAAYEAGRSAAKALDIGKLPINHPTGKKKAPRPLDLSA
jgi:hypothetical protein